MSAEQHINPQDYEWLSAYIDDELSDLERATLEERLTNDPILRQELNSLQATVTLMTQLQPMTAPRDFTLTQDMVNEAKIIPFKRYRRNQTSYLSMVASIAVMLVGFIFIFTEVNTMSTNELARLQSAPASEIVPTEITLDEEQRERTVEEPAPMESFAFDADDAPADDDALLGMQAPSDESLADRDDNGLDGSDGFTGGSTQALEAVIVDENAGDDMSEITTGADSAEAEVSSDAEVMSDTTTADTEGAVANQPSGEFDDADERQGIVGDLAQEENVDDVADEVREESSIEKSQSDNSGLLIGLGLLIFGFLMFGVSVIFMRRNRG